MQSYISNPTKKYLLSSINDKTDYLVWWILADLFPDRIRMCEEMATLVCETGLLKSTDCRLKRMTFSNKMCSNCDLGILEDVKHIVMQCPFYSDERNRMHDLLSTLESDCAVRVVADNQNFFSTM